MGGQFSQFSTAAKLSPLIGIRAGPFLYSIIQIRRGDPMKRIYFICLFQFLTATFLLSQSNPVPLTNQSARVVSPINVSQADPKAQPRILGQRQSARSQ